MDDKAWPSLNEAVNEELKPDSVINNAKGSAHELVKVIDSSEVACYTVFLLSILNKALIFQINILFTFGTCFYISF